MTYFVLSPLHPKYQIFADQVDWDKKVPNLHRQVEISGYWRYGGVILDPLEMPEALKLEKRRKSLPDTFRADNAIVICSERINAVLEELDPGVHQFFPIRILQPDGKPVEGRHYILNVHHSLDTIVDELTESTNFPSTVPGNPKRHEKMLTYNSEQESGVAFRKSRLTSVNLWREIAYPGLYMMSDRLYERLRRDGLSFFKILKAREC
jgi:hypothetical protein